MSFEDMLQAVGAIEAGMRRPFTFAREGALWMLANVFYWVADSLNPYVGEYRAPSARARLRGSWARFWAQYEAHRKAREQMQAALAAGAAWWEKRRQDYAPAYARVAAGARA